MKQKQTNASKKKKILGIFSFNNFLPFILPLFPLLTLCVTSVKCSLRTSNWTMTFVANNHSN